jgi:hypothetical protein
MRSTAGFDMVDGKKRQLSLPIARASPAIVTDRLLAETAVIRQRRQVLRRHKTLPLTRSPSTRRTFEISQPSLTTRPA